MMTWPHAPQQTRRGRRRCNRDRKRIFPVCLRPRPKRREIGLLQGQMFDTLRHIGGIIDLGHEFQVPDALADGHPHLVGVDDARKLNGMGLPRGTFGQEIVVLSK